MASNSPKSPSHQSIPARKTATGRAPGVLRAAERYRNLVEQAVDGIFIADEDGIYVEVNESGARLFGLSPDKIIGRRVADFVCAEDRAQLADDWAALQNGSAITRERRFSRADGTSFPGEVSAKRLPDGLYQGIVRDITARKQAETALRQSEERFRNLTASAFEGICIHDQGTIVEVNEQFARMCGYERGELIGRDALSLVAPESLPAMLRVIREAEDAAREHLIVRKDGTRLAVESQAKSTFWGTRPVRVVAVRDISAHKAAEAARRESEAKFTKVFRVSPVPILITDYRTAEIVEVNDAFLRTFECERPDVLGHTTLQLGFWVDPQERQNLLQLLSRSSTVHNFTGRARTRGGRTISVRLHCEVIELGGRSCILMMAEDVTEQERAEAALRESEEKFAKAFRANPNPIIISDLETGRIVDVNEAFLRLRGETRDQILGRTTLEAGLWQDPSIREQFLQKLRAQGSFHGLRAHGWTRRGEETTVLVSAELIELGGRTVVLGMAQDITEQERAVEALRESEEKFATAFRSAPDALAISDFETGRYVDVNEGFERLFRYAREEVIGHTSIELGIWPNSLARAAFLAELDVTGALRDVEVESRNRRGEAVVYLLSAECMTLGGRRCIVSANHDITDRKRAERERARAIESERQAREAFTHRLIAAQEAERRRIAGELHDSLGQNLLLVKNRAQLALQGDVVPAELRWQFESIHDLAAQALAEVRQISHDLRPYQLDQLGLTRALEGMIDGARRNTGFAFARRIDPIDDLFPGETATHVFRIVQECMNNVLKHARAASAQILIERDVHHVRLWIEDDGCGFATTVGAGQGETGFGLKNIAERARILGGTLQVDSAAGTGTRIEVLVPIAEERQ